MSNNNRKKIALASLLLLILLIQVLGAFFPFGKNKDQVAPRILKVGYLADNPPLTFTKQSKGYGLEIDLLDKFLQSIGLARSVKFEEVSFANAKRDLKQGKYDILLVGADIIPTSDYLFSKGYYSNSLSLLSKDRHLNSLKNKKIGALRESSAERFLLKKKQKAASIKVYSNIPEWLVEGIDLETDELLAQLVAQVVNNRIDAILLDSSTAEYYQSQHPELTLTKLKKSSVKQGAIFSLANKELRDAYDLFLEKMEKEKKLAKLVSSWQNYYKNNKGVKNGTKS